MGRRVGTLATFLVMLVAGGLLASGIFQFYAPEAPPAPIEAPPADLGRVRVEIRNAGGRSGMARKATDYLRDLGFDVVYFGNADRFDQQETVVVDRVGRLDKARAVADVLDAATVISEADSTLYLDVTVLLGAEWDLAEPEPENVRALPWWNLTRWMRQPTTESPESGNES